MLLIFLLCFPCTVSLQCPNGWGFRTSTNCGNGRKSLQKAYGTVANSENGRKPFKKVIESIWKLISEANKYVDENAPWKLLKKDKERAGDVLNILVLIIAKIAIFSSQNYSIKSHNSFASKKLNKEDLIYINSKKINISSSLIRKFW